MKLKLWKADIECAFKETSVILNGTKYESDYYKAVGKMVITYLNCPDYGKETVGGYHELK